MKLIKYGHILPVVSGSILLYFNLCNYSMHLILCISSVRLNLCILFYAFYSIDIFYINLQELYIPFEAWKQTLKPTDRPTNRLTDGH